jgi:alkyldihydroxyacetonephosphate synthase
MLAGSEGALGLITEAWVRVQPRPQHRRSAGVLFSGFSAGAECVRALGQSGLSPANCRLIDAREAAMTMAAEQRSKIGQRALLVLGFESTDHPVDEAMSRALAICAEHGGEVPADKPAGGGDRSGGDAVGSWRDAFLGAPYARDVLVAMGVLAETFETAITWERFAGFHERVKAAGEQVLGELCGEGGRVTARFTHVYPNGPAVYFTVIAPARRGEEVEQWAQIKAAVSEAILAEGGTITHHHAVGRDHRPWYEQQRPDPFAAAFAGAKAAVDPQGVMNPGVLIDSAAAAVSR